MRARVRKAFTLVEILIVVVILGILAAIVVPQFTNATEQAQAGNLSAQLDTLNNQLELYKAQNAGQNPADLTAGGTAVVMATQTYDCWATMVAQGYIKLPPRNPACPRVGTGDNQYYVQPGAPAANVGWNFEDTNGDSVLDTIKASYYDELANVVTPGVP